MINKIYFDLDGVMANFEKAVVEIVGVHYWDRTTDKFWKEFGTVPNLYANLDVLPGALGMFNTVLGIHDYDVVEVLTAYPKPTDLLHTASEDKINWFHERINHNVKVNTIEGGANKYKFLEENPNSVLIDDYDRNIKKWIEHGGCGVLHTDPDSTLAKLKLLGLL